MPTRIEKIEASKIFLADLSPATSALSVNVTDQATQKPLLSGVVQREPESDQLVIDISKAQPYPGIDFADVTPNMPLEVKLTPLAADHHQVGEPVSTIEAKLDMTDIAQIVSRISPPEGGGAQPEVRRPDQHEQRPDDRRERREPRPEIRRPEFREREREQRDPRNERGERRDPRGDRPGEQRGEREDRPSLREQRDAEREQRLNARFGDRVTQLERDVRDTRHDVQGINNTLRGMGGMEERLMAALRQPAQAGTVPPVTTTTTATTPASGGGNANANQAVPTPTAAVVQPRGWRVKDAVILAAFLAFVLGLVIVFLAHYHSTPAANPTIPYNPNTIPLVQNSPQLPPQAAAREPAPATPQAPVVIDNRETRFMKRSLPQGHTAPQPPAPKAPKVEKKSSPPPEPAPSQVPPPREEGEVVSPRRSSLHDGSQRTWGPPVGPPPSWYYQQQQTPQVIVVQAPQPQVIQQQPVYSGSGYSNWIVPAAVGYGVGYALNRHHHGYLQAEYGRNCAPGYWSTNRAFAPSAPIHRIYHGYGKPW